MVFGQGSMEGVEVNASFWRQKRVLVTGHTGFKGGWMSLWLQQMGAAVTGFALAPSTTPSLFESARVADGMASVIGDISDYQAVRDVFSAAQPEVVIHMAAQPLVRQSYFDPLETYRTNVMGTAHVLEAVRHTPSVAAAVVVTTDKCYENREWVWGYRETDALGGHDPYSNSKACAELVTHAYRNSFFSGDRSVALASVRAGNVIGGGDWSADRLVPDVFRALENNETVKVRNPKSIRPWQHVLEPVRGYLLLAERLVQEGGGLAEAWNFGPNENDAHPVDWLVAEIQRRWGLAQPQWEHTGGSEALHETRSLRLDSSKARELLQWKPALTLGAALQLTVDWVRERGRGADMRQVTLSQIESYEAMVRKNADARA